MMRAARAAGSSRLYVVRLNERSAAHAGGLVAAGPRRRCLPSVAWLRI